MKYYVYFYKNGNQICHCFEQDKEQAEHFAKNVNGEIIIDY